MTKEAIITLLVSIKQKAAYLLGIGFGLIAPIQFILLLVGAFIAADTVFGVWAAKKQKKKITSNRFSSFIGKMLVYQTVVIIAYALDINLLGEFLLAIVSIKLLLTKMVAIALIVNECYSIDEKLVNVKGKGIFHYFKQLLGLAKLVKKEAKELTNDEK